MNLQVALTKNKRQLYETELIEIMSRFAHKNGLAEVLPNIWIAHSFQPTESEMSVSKSVICVIAQGSKAVYLNETLFHYSAGSYLISTLNLPIKSKVVEASKDKPYLNFMIVIDPTLIADVMLELSIIPTNTPSVKAMDVGLLDVDLLEGVVKLARLFDNPYDAQFLAPLILREMIYRLLRGDQSARLSQSISGAGNTYRIGQAVQYIRQNIAQPLSIDELAREQGMSVSSFHQHFKTIVAMSPLQFQKQIRLQEARRLMLSDNMDVATASNCVGYDDPSYFIRQYKKLFGTPPHKDIVKLRDHMSNA